MKIKQNTQNMEANLLFIVFVLFVILAVGTLIYFLTVKAPDKTKLWGWWGLGVAGFIMGALFVLWMSLSYTPVEKYKQAVQQAANDPNCRTAREQCYLGKIALKREHDKQRELYNEIEDQAAINACDKESSTNTCIETVLDACANAVKSRNDAELTSQFNDFRQKHPAPEVLQFCKTVTSG